jgi:hypothetical protein
MQEGLTFNADNFIQWNLINDVRGEYLASGVNEIRDWIFHFSKNAVTLPELSSAHIQMRASATRIR